MIITKKQAAKTVKSQIITEFLQNNIKYLTKIMVTLVAVIVGSSIV